MTVKPWQTVKPWRVRFWETHLSFVPDFVSKSNVWCLRPRTTRDSSRFCEWLDGFCPHAVLVKWDKAISARYWLNQHAEGFYGCYFHDPGFPEPGPDAPMKVFDKATVFRFRDPPMAFDIKMRFG